MIDLGFPVELLGLGVLALLGAVLFLYAALSAVWEDDDTVGFGENVAQVPSEAPTSLPKRPNACSGTSAPLGRTP